MSTSADTSQSTSRPAPEPDGATPIEAEELDDLIPEHLRTRAELNEWEQANILQAQSWLGRPKQLLTVKYLKDLHRRMFGQTWRWAGQFRQTLKSIGVPADQVSVELQKLLDDATFWVGNETYAPDEIGIRFHHRLVAIHPFPNGNGRHARESADRLLVRLGRPRFTWGSASLIGEGVARARYLEALKAANVGEYGSLRRFVRE